LDRHKQRTDTPPVTSLKSVRTASCIFQVTESRHIKHQEGVYRFTLPRASSHTGVSITSYKTFSRQEYM